MPVAKPESSDSRIIAHIDMDCFYVQVEQRKQPQLRGLATAVVQYNSWKGGGLIAVSYEARKYGVKRSMRGDEAKEVCPQIQLVQVPVARGKADLKIYRDAGSEVVSILSRKGRCERASIDEVYLDLTDAAETMIANSPPESLEVIDEEALKSHILGLVSEDESNSHEKAREWLCSSNAEYRDKLLACGALIVAELRRQVLEETEFTCSAGIAHNKMLAKLASAMNKPAQQTVVPLCCVKGLLDSFPIKKMKQLGGKLGDSLQSGLGVNTVGDLLKFPEEKLQECYGINTGSWLWNIARGINGEDVEWRLLPKSHGSGKTFPGRQALKTISSVQQWLTDLCEELNERLQSDLDQNKRIARTLTLHASAYKSSASDTHRKFPSKSCPLRYGAARIQEDALNLFQAGLREYLGPYSVNTQGNLNTGWGITAISVSASKILPIPSGTCSIKKYFQDQVSSCTPLKQSKDDFSATTLSGCESCSELNSNGEQDGFTAEEIKIEQTAPLSSLDQQEHKQDLQKDEGSSCSSAEQVQEILTRESLLLSLGNSSCSALSISEPQIVSLEDQRIKDAKSSSQQPEQKRKELKNKGTYSILKFFNRGPASTSRKQEQENVGASPSADGNPIEETDQTSQTEQRAREAWNYRIDEIDPSVIEELPPEIQEEFRAWLRPSKRPNLVPKASNIASYFLPCQK